MHKTLEVRTIDVNDYEQIGLWFSLRGWPTPPSWDHLPKGDRALCVIDNVGTLVACGFVYFTETPLTMLEWTATNPDVKSLKTRYKAVTLLLDAAKLVAKHHKPDAVLIQFLVSSGLKKLYEKHGFRVGDTGLTSMIWRG